MHPNPIFRTTPADTNLTMARTRGFGILSVNGPDGPLASHIPFLVAQDGRSVDLHLVRSNPIVRALKTAHPALLAVSGPDGYVSPDWYGTPDQVPTWNYTAVHLRGSLSLLPDNALRGILDDLSARFEADLRPKPPWTADKMTPDAMERMMRQIVPVRLDLTDVQGTWKLNQNKTDAVRHAAADGMEQAGRKTLADLMRNPPA